MRQVTAFPPPSCWALKAPSLFSVLCFQGRMWERHAFEERGSPQTRWSQRSWDRAPRRFHAPRRAAPRPRRGDPVRTSGRPIPLAARGSWARGEGGPETGARKTAGLANQQGPPLGDGERSAGRRCPLVAAAGADSRAVASPAGWGHLQTCALIPGASHLARRGFCSCGEFPHHPVLHGGYFLPESASPAAPHAKDSGLQGITRAHETSLTPPRFGVVIRRAQCANTGFIELARSRAYL